MDCHNRYVARYSCWCCYVIVFWHRTSEVVARNSECQISGTSIPGTYHYNRIMQEYYSQSVINISSRQFLLKQTIQKHLIYCRPLLLNDPYPTRSTPVSCSLPHGLDACLPPRLNVTAAWTTSHRRVRVQFDSLSKGCIGWLVSAPGTKSNR